MTTPPSPTRGSTSSSSLPGMTSVQTTPPRKKRRLGAKILGVLMLLVVVGLSLWTWVALSYRYAIGQKTGYVRNLTKHGWICKTWEGEMNVAPINGVASPNFRFTIRSDSLATVVQNLIGKEVTVDYSEHIKLPSSCLGETPFFIEGARGALP